MRKISKILVSLFVFINIFTMNILADDLEYIEEALTNIGINEDYSENIVQYLTNIYITESDIQKIEDNIDNIRELVADKDKKEMSLFEYYNIYSNIMEISEMLNLDLDIDMNNFNIKLTDKRNNNILFEGDTNTLFQIYSNYKEGNYNINIAAIVEDINLNIKENQSEEKTNDSEEQVDEKIDNSLNTERIINNSNNNSEINVVLDEYINKFNKYNESLMVKNNTDMLEFKIIVFVFGIALILFIVFKILSGVKKITRKSI